jgi:hypothetical protein
VNGPTPSHNAHGGSTIATVLERSLGGVVACVVAAVPLAVGWTLWGFYVDRSDRDWSVAYVLISTVTVTLFALPIAAFSAVCFGMPVYALASRAKRLRPLLLLLGATVVGVVVMETWHGGAFLEDPESTIQFAFFGFYSGIAFWLGADVWQPIK